MSRRRPKGELQFGSDSFLDVVANIVGILIILIVIAGLRVSQMPVVTKSSLPDSAEELQIPIPAAMPEIEQPPETIVPTPAPPQVVALEPVIEQPEEPEPEPPRPLPPLAVPPDLEELANRLQTEIAALRAAEMELDGQLRQTGKQQSSLREHHRTIQLQLIEKTKQQSAAQQQVAAVEADLELARETLQRLTKQVQEIQSIPVHVETLEHKITPISRSVSGKEKHYRLEKNRVMEVPIDELVARFREQIDRRKDWLVKTRQHQGQIGPIRGFSMKYLVRVDSMSDLDALRMGHGGFRISLANWEVIPEPDATGETAEAALKKGSEFYQSILGTSPDTTLTFWVYPDSYPLFRKLQKFTHDHGYSVAGRPLPDGVPIAGSPNGSKSASQ